MIRWNIIFHERLYADHYKTLPREDMRRHIQFIGVNELYEKTIPPEIPRECVVYEKDFPGYDPLLQMCRYYESSVMFNLHRTPSLLDGTSFVGFGQYDMTFPAAAMEQIKAIPPEDNDDVLVYQSQSDPRLLFNNPLTVEEWRAVVAHFNEHHGSQFGLEDVLTKPFLLFHSYGMSVKQFHIMMKWIVAVQPLMLRFLRFDKRHVCGTIERFYGIYCTLHQLMGTFKRIVVLQGMDHLNDKKFQDVVKSFCVDPSPKETMPAVPSVPIPVAKPLSILLVGHGNMSIPPNGWGAVESLIYEYKCGLERLGHTVSILNTGEAHAIVVHLRSKTYDYVHFHNDALVNLLEHVSPTVNIAITSHYPYIQDKSRWHDKTTGYNYETVIMAPLLKHLKAGRRIVVCALSQKDYDAFVSYGIPTSSLRLCINGFNSERFVVSDAPQHGGETICLAQIIKRKRQSLLYGIPEIRYVGKVNDASMAPPAAQYLGQWTDAEKYARLSHYGNSVLVSDGENGTPLSVKESLGVGLGVVVTAAAASELPADWFWATVVDEATARDPAALRLACESNRLVTAAVRPIIREKAKALWDWSVLVPFYVESMRTAFRLN
jgi:hypothetical protein